MVKYEKGFNHINTTDIEEEVVSITSIEEEPKHINRIVMSRKQVQDGYLYGYIEREKIIDAVPHLLAMVDSIPIEFPIDIDIPVGETFTLKLVNVAAGVNANAGGYVEYEITE